MPEEPRPDIGCCSVCGEGFPVCDLKTEQDGDWETGYYDIHICPKCPDGGCIDDYTMSVEQAEEWWKWNSVTDKS